MCGPLPQSASMSTYTTYLHIMAHLILRVFIHNCTCHSVTTVLFLDYFQIRHLNWPTREDISPLHTPLHPMHAEIVFRVVHARLSVQIQEHCWQAEKERYTKSFFCCKSQSSSEFFLNGLQFPFKHQISQGALVAVIGHFSGCQPVPFSPMCHYFILQWCRGLWEEPQHPAVDMCKCWRETPHLPERFKILSFAFISFSGNRITFKYIYYYTQYSNYLETSDITGRRFIFLL